MFCGWESWREELKGRDSESKEQCELEVYLESLAGRVDSQWRVFFPPARDQRAEDPEA